MEHLYFAYGSNLNIEQMMMRCPTAQPVRRMIINNWRLVFRGVADIEPCRNSRVYGALYSVLPADIIELDRYEGVKNGLYRSVTFRIPETNEVAFFYRMNETGIYPPSRYYFECIAQGYKDWRLPIKHLKNARTESYEQFFSAAGD